MNDPQPIGELIDNLGVLATLDDGDLVTAVIVVIKVVEPDGAIRLTSAFSEGLDWVNRFGMLTAAAEAEGPAYAALDS